MKIKTSDKLDEMFQKLIEYDYKYVDDILIKHADCYTVDGDGSLIEEGVQLGITAQDLEKPVYKVVNNGAEAFFVGDYKSIASILRQKIQEAEKVSEENKKFEQNKLHENERTKLLFLLDALRVAPEKSQKLISMVKTKNTSTAFQQFLNTLSTSANLQKTVADLRKSLL